MTRAEADQTSSAGELRLDMLVGHLVEELACLARLAQSVQHALGQCEFAAPPRPAVSADLQGIDRISQSLDDLQRLMAGLGGTFPASATVEAQGMRSRIRLRELADRLINADENSAADGSICGDVNLF